MGIPTERLATHPGEVLLEEYIKPLGLTQAALAKDLGISTNRLNELVRQKRGITADTALRLAHRFKTSPEFWMNLQSVYELTEARMSKGVPAD
jgi:addiction module HigA family antidote